ncbi:PREDICTED: putative F-box protein At1g77650 [Camelina sativa]|uniref:F-box protein At1g77650 n=1 Tax=Camelina sativa TaxID=90675 RepID=A0ABM0W056_CAMSA|nr:PREDICTED: putative F-box protein At1g77650 [Camelina sativa]
MLLLASDKYGFGYDNDHNYKVLKFQYYPTNSEYEIYDFKSKLWRVFPAITFDWIMLWQYVSMKGNMYWLAKPRSARGYSQMFIQSFDFSKETFKPLTCSSSFPVKIEVDLVRHESLNLVVLSSFGGDRLSLLHQHRVGHDDTPRIEVWVTNKVTDAAAAVSWTKYFNVTHPHLPILNPRAYAHSIPTYFIHDKTNGGGGGLMLWCDKLLVQEEDKDDVQIKDDDIACPSFYEISEGGEIKNQVETGPLWYARGRSTYRCGSLYVPSLVPLPE